MKIRYIWHSFDWSRSSFMIGIIFMLHDLSRVAMVNSGTPPFVPPSADCALRKLAWEYGQHLKPDKHSFATLFDALQLDACHVPRPSQGKKCLLNECVSLASNVHPPLQMINGCHQVDTTVRKQRRHCSLNRRVVAKRQKVRIKRKPFQQSLMH